MKDSNSNKVRLSFEVDLTRILFLFEEKNQDGLTVKDFKKYLQKNPEVLENYLSLLTKIAKYAVLYNADEEDSVIALADKVGKAIIKEKEDTKPSAKKIKI